MRDWEFVELLREYVIVNRTFASLFDRFRQGSPCFEEVALLVGDGDNSILFRLKERCHALFRVDPSEAPQMHHEVLFDLTVGSLFHEAMKLRENLYQHEVYVPKVERLLEDHGPDDSEFFKEFEKIQAAGEDRTQNAMRETEVLLAQTRKQLRALLVSRSDSTLLTRNLVENREAVESAFGSDLESLLAGIHGSVAAGFASAADSFLESAFFEQATECLDAALAQPDEAHDNRGQLARLREYATGMQHFSNGDYEASLASLASWLDAEPGEGESQYLKFAESVLSRVGNLLGDDSDPELQVRANALTERIQGRVQASESTK